MKCPICELQIENNESKVWFCPHCFSILDEQFKTNCLPKSDGHGENIVEYTPTVEKQRTFARTDKVLLKCYEETMPKPPKSLIMKLWSSPLIVIAIAIALWFLVHPVAAIISFVFMIVAITVWMTVEINHVSKPKLQEVVFGPIIHYGNKNTYGFVKVNIGDYNKTNSPQCEFVEINKKNIIAVDYDDDKLMHILHIKKSSNIKNNIIYVPDIFEEQLIQKIFR